MWHETEVFLRCRHSGVKPRKSWANCSQFTKAQGPKRPEAHGLKPGASRTEWSRLAPPASFPASQAVISPSRAEGALQSFLGSQGFSASLRSPFLLEISSTCQTPHYPGGLRSEPWKQAGMDSCLLEVLTYGGIPEERPAGR